MFDLVEQSTLKEQNKQKCARKTLQIYETDKHQTINGLKSDIEWSNTSMGVGCAARRSYSVRSESKRE